MLQYSNTQDPLWHFKSVIGKGIDTSGNFQFVKPIIRYKHWRSLFNQTDLLDRVGNPIAKSDILWEVMVLQDIPIHHKWPSSAPPTSFSPAESKFVQKWMPKLRPDKRKYLSENQYFSKLFPNIDLIQFTPFGRKIWSGSMHWERHWK